MRILLATSFSLLCASCASRPPACSDGDVQEIVGGMLRDQAPILALIANPIFPARVILAASPAAVSALADQEYGKAFAAVQDIYLKGEGAKQATIHALVTAAANSTVAVSDVTTISKSEHKTECELTADFTLEFPGAAELDEYGAKLVQEPGVVRALRQQRKYEAFYNDDGEVLVRLFPAQ